MKALTKTVLATLITLSATLPAAAASTAGRADHSGILVWAFLGFCALIVVLFATIKELRLSDYLDSSGVFSS
jgi:hypothetical protein